jgi:hypothetical protein
MSKSADIESSPHVVGRRRLSEPRLLALLIARLRAPLKSGVSESARGAGPRLGGIRFFTREYSSMPTDLITKDAVPPLPYREFEKTRLTHAVRMEGTFHCLTSEGNVASCTDGWLAIDSEGYPYPVNAQEFDRTYRPVDDH